MKIMENESNTKETWYRNEAGDEIHSFIKNDETAVLSLVGIWYDSTNKKEENITLIAAAPDLLAGLIYLLDRVQPKYSQTPQYIAACKAVDKATLTTTTTNTNKGTKQ